MTRTITVIKRNIDGQETWRYSGRLLEQGEDYLVLEAFFDRDDMELNGLLLLHGDRFVETWYTGRWYNIFAVHARSDGHIRGWYCNIGRPAVWEDSDRLSYIDLALDLLVFPNGRQVVLDEDEFNELPLTPEDRQQALRALAELQNRSWII